MVDLPQEMKKAPQEIKAYETAPSAKVVEEGEDLFPYDFDELINNICHLLGGEKQTQSGEWVNDPNREALMNKKGINWFEIYFKANLNKELVFSNLSNSQVLTMLRRVRNTTILKLYYCKDEFDIGYSDLDPILDIITNNVLPVLRRAYKGGEREALSKTQKREIRVREENKGGKGWSFLPGTGGGKRK